MLDIWRQALARIKSSGIPYTIFYPTNFMETLPQRHSTGQLFVMLGRARYCNYWIAGSDFGRQVREVVRAAAGGEPRVLHSGAGADDLRRGGGALCARLAPIAVYRSRAVLAARLGGLFSDRLNFNANIMHTVLSYPEEFKASETWSDLGKPTTTIEEFALGQSKT